ncbi:Uncharacterised protein [Vibrio cholerae]|nr:Uncharacterised protein [Vibrio cholerae]CSD29233.1 Uncharacterised protein [Vibrio cholerae]
MRVKHSDRKGTKNDRFTSCSHRICRGFRCLGRFERSTQRKKPITTQKKNSSQSDTN